MISSLQLSKIIKIIIFLFFFITNSVISIAAEDIWKKKENNEEQKIESDEEEITIKSPILSTNIEKIKIKIDEEKVENFKFDFSQFCLNLRV